jgi:8-oxo-dGTP pyrophosphatase MutT (NUDIX family)
MTSKFGQKVYREYPLLEAIMQEVDERFIIGLDPQVLTDSKMIFFKIQKAFWFYKDKHERLIKDRKIPAMPLDVFGQLLIEESQVLSRVYPHEQRAAKYREWQEFLRRVPRLGAICINPTADKVLMIQPFGRNRKCMQFPRGKLHAGEEHPRAAAREVWEECGIRIENLIDEERWCEATIDQTLHKLYLVFPVMEELVPSIQCNKEIEQILWVPLVDLPGYARVPHDDKGFFGVAPFVGYIKSFVKRLAGTRQPALPQIKILKRPTVSRPEEDMADEEDAAADRFNADAFGSADASAKGWDFEAMLAANTKLGYQSSYNESSFDAAYSVPLPSRPRSDSVQQLTVLDGGRVMAAFREGWNSRS